jgi:hypothetical protein
MQVRVLHLSATAVLFAMGALSAPAADTADRKDIVATAIAAEQFKTLVSAVKAAN